ncbi:peptidase M19 renal dipeptidase [Thermaerobacter marianensis DSM 12885]|uniref:Peptidase M19 renal dipeptidase n=1 Tax=Thermaerobacter marianensis (strain ATCC 700841 / DSM 12885 / JCM 10246 / 7p75a) TaxID=644966 RepID=E6SHV0_THEM7|nr:membrane dipeptidase [Thermaerobacter marianensis]ADU50797.1 peptidase M19 renal dipeptidase [Thermaerobacter marianensis DSM 12885]
MGNPSPEPAPGAPSRSARMPAKKRYNGYRSFQYLEPGVDYRPFVLAAEINRVEPYVVEVSEAQEERVQRLLAENVVISLHEHLMVIPDDVSQVFDYIREGRIFTGYEGLAASGLDAVCENFLNGAATITSKMGWKWTDIIHDIGMRFADLAHQDFVIRAERVDDILRAHAEGRVALIPSLEAATPIENELDRLDVLYGLGIRMMGIAYSEGNALGCGLREPSDGGLTVFGRQAVERMNKLGIAIDVSHSGDQTALDTIRHSKKPVFITHAGARALWPSRRLKPDEVIKACAERGGVIGIEAAPHTTLTRNHPEHSIESVMEHFEYCVELVGIDHVTFGPDLLFGDHVALHKAFAAHLSIGESRAKGEDFPHVPYVRGMENIAEAWPNIVRWLVKHNYSDDEIKKVIGGNTLRVLREVWHG